MIGGRHTGRQRFGLFLSPEEREEVRMIQNEVIAGLHRPPASHPSLHTFRSRLLTGILRSSSSSRRTCSRSVVSISRASWITVSLHFLSMSPGGQFFRHHWRSSRGNVGVVEAMANKSRQAIAAIQRLPVAIDLLSSDRPGVISFSRSARRLCLSFCR